MNALTLNRYKCPIVVRKKMYVSLVIFIFLPKKCYFYFLNQGHGPYSLSD